MSDNETLLDGKVNEERKDKAELIHNTINLFTRATHSESLQLLLYRMMNEMFLTNAAN